MALIRQINLFQILNYKVTMTIEKWVKEEKMRLGRFKICCVNAQKEEGKSFPLKMPRSCWSGQYRSWDDFRCFIYPLMPSQHANVGEKPIVQYQSTGTPKPLANPTECQEPVKTQHCVWPKIRLPKWNRKETRTPGLRSQLIRTN